MEVKKVPLIIFLTLVIASATFSIRVSAQEQTLNNDVAAHIAQRYKEIISAELKSRNNEIGRYYDPAAIIIIPKYPPMNRDGAAEALEERAQPEYSFVAGEVETPISLVVNGNMALDVEEVDLTVKETLDRNSRWQGIHKGLRSLTVWKLEEDGEWRILRQTFTNNS